MKTSNKLLSYNGNVGLYSYGFPPKTAVIAGDSGSPVYTAPDANGNVYILGTLTGKAKFPGETTSSAIFSPWNDIANMLDLKPID